MKLLCFIFAICGLVHDINNYFHIMALEGKIIKMDIVSIICSKSHKEATMQNSFDINYINDQLTTSMFYPVLRNLAESIFSGKNRKADILASQEKTDLT